MSEQYRIVDVDGSNVEQEGFFCYKSKPKSEGYQRKLAWLRQRFEEGMRIKILYEGARSVGTIEYLPGEVAWRAVEAPDFLLIHCLWVVGKGKGKGYGSLLLDECFEDARRSGKQGVVMVSSRGNWLANERIFLKNGFVSVGEAPPAFKLLVKEVRPGPAPSFPANWDERAAAFGPGATIVYADQCPYMPDAVSQALDAFHECGVEARAVRLEDAETVRRESPSAYGVFGIVYRGKLFAYHYLGKRELRQLDAEAGGAAG